MECDRLVHHTDCVNCVHVDANTLYSAGSETHVAEWNLKSARFTRSFADCESTISAIKVVNRQKKKSEKKYGYCCAALCHVGPSDVCPPPQVSMHRVIRSLGVQCQGKGHCGVEANRVILSILSA